MNVEAIANNLVRSFMEESAPLLRDAVKTLMEEQENGTPLDRWLGGSGQLLCEEDASEVLAANFHLSGGEHSAVLERWRNLRYAARSERGRVAADQHPERTSWFEAMGRLLWQPAWSVAGALLLAAFVGAWGGIASTWRTADSSQAELQFLAPGTLAGSYLQGAARELR